MSAIEEAVKPEVFIVHTHTLPDAIYGETEYYDLYIGEKKMGKGTQRPRIAVAVIRYGEGPITMIVTGSGETLREAIHDIFTNGIAAKQQDVDALKALALDYGEQLALAASHLETADVH